MPGWPLKQNTGVLSFFFSWIFFIIEGVVGSWEYRKFPIIGEVGGSGESCQYSDTPIIG